jgi:hypothetical protein
MFLLRSLLAMGLIFGLTGLADAAEGAKAKKKAAGFLKAVVKSVEASKDKPDAGTLTVQTTGKAKKGQPPPAGEEKKITITSDTKIEKLEGKAKAKKGQPPPAGSPAKLSDVSSSSNVLITLKAGENNVAEKVQIVAAKKKAKKKANG